jgi:DEAD/DEAH box helicase domain-containing protein
MPQENIDLDPVGSWDQLQENLKLYIRSAFGTNSSSFESDRQNLIDTPGVLFQEQFLEMLQSYKSGKRLIDLDEDDLPGMSPLARKVFQSLAGAELMPQTATLYLHQQRMLKAAMERKHCVVVTGTGSGKTESFLLPVFASIVKDAIDGPSKWGNVRNKNLTAWDDANPPSWKLNRQTERGENRTAAVRSLLLYPMNALVEDQMSRLRVSLDSDTTHAVLDAHLGGNRIRFGRYNGSTPVAGHPWKIDSNGMFAPNSQKRTDLKDDFKIAIKQYKALKQRAKQAEIHLQQARDSGVETDIQDAERLFKEIIEQSSFIPRMEIDAAEMFHRWEMQESPPDLLITNVSMLSIMLMRHPHDVIPDDRADSQIFETTKEWLAEDRENRVFQLVIDELHLYRGASGTEVGYLLRLLIDRLGLSPDSNQLQILASSASLDGSSNSTYDFLGGFFGLSPTEAKNRFHIEGGETVFQSPKYSLAFPDEIVEKFINLGSDPKNEQLSSLAVNELIGSPNANELIQFFAAGFWDQITKRHRALSINNLAQFWFDRIVDQKKQHDAARGLLIAIGSAAKAASGKNPHLLTSIPRIRFHWMVKNIDGLWATIGLNVNDDRRRVGQLLAEPRMSLNSKRVLEVLYCECCGTQLLAGYKIHAGWQDNKERIELAPMPPTIEGMPESIPQTRTDAQPYLQLGVVYLVPHNWSHPDDSAALKWKQCTNEKTDQRRPLATEEARWVEAAIDPKSGIVELNQIPREGWIKCLWFKLDTDESQIPRIPAMPQVCPSCLMNYSENMGGRNSPIRSFATGLTQVSLLLTKHLMAVMPAGPSRRLVAFSDSRQSAATLANGVEIAQWRNLMSIFVLQELKERAKGGIHLLKRALLDALKANDSNKVKDIIEEAKAKYSIDEVEDLLNFRSSAKSVLDDGEFASAKEKNLVTQVETYKFGYVRVDDFLHNPDPQSADLPSIWKRFAEIGMNPAGSGVDARRLTDTEDWTSLIRKVQINGVDRPQLLGVPLSQTRAAQLANLSFKVKSQAWQAISGRLLYDLEAQGVGHLAVSPGFSGVPPKGISPQVFREICDSVIRLLTEANRTDPSQRDRPSTPWNFDQPKGSSQEGVHKKRTVQYLKACTSSHSVSWEELRDRVRDALMQEQHVIGQDWGIVSMSQLWVFVVDRSAKPWICSRCTRIHWHASAGVCVRCQEKLESFPNGTLTATQIEKQNYYSNLSSQSNNAFRIHAEELTGQTNDQAQRQRHFRNIFFEGEVIDDVVSRNVIPSVDGIDLLSVTTTMEVGVDIGGLQSIFQANMPPERFNYQQRAGRAGRKQQAFSVVLTYCRGQTHDRIHYSHPEEMTSGVPPQPTVSVSDDQRILAERLVSKEVLRRAFNAAGSNWSISGTPSDTHGEMATVGYYLDNQTFQDSINQWLLSNRKSIEAIAKVVARGTSILENDLVVTCQQLPARILRAALGEPDRDRGLAHTLADAGILPMYGMPTAIRSLYFSLPSQPSFGREAKTLDRTLDQAVSEFAPNSSRIWDKRLLSPKGLTGPIRHFRSHVWKTQGSPIGEVTWQLFCRECRNLNVYRADKSTFKPLDPIKGWEESWLINPDIVQCPNCLQDGANIYMAVTPNGFLTDLDTSVPAGSMDSSSSISPTSFIASPSITNASHTVSGGVLLALSSQQKVYRISQNSEGNSFGFSRSNSLRQSQPSQILEADLGIWLSNEKTPAIKASLVSPKTTDIFSIRLLDRQGLAFFDSERKLACRRAGWYSAATILQRSIAIELDIDSLDIEIASVHMFSDANGSKGAELYLADEHPNGAGLVYWAHKNWTELLNGCLSAQGPFARLGNLIRNECQLSKHQSQPWRSPDILLKGFRNRQLHGLIDWRLGLELLATMHDSAHIPGRTPLFETWGLGLTSWEEEARLLAEQYFDAFEHSTSVRFDSTTGLHGWVSDNSINEQDKTLNVVSHPLWKFDGSGNDSLGAELLNLATKHNADAIRLIDSFNLSRRLSWVKGNLNYFPLFVLSSMQKSSSGSPEANWMKKLLVAIEGESIVHQGKKWTRYPLQDAWTSKNGVWLSCINDQTIYEVTIRNIPGAGVKIKPQGAGNPFLSRDQYSTLKVFARREEEGEGK